MKNQGIEADILKSFDLALNKKSIHRGKAADGGKGGEFFFFSADYKMIIKSLTREELMTFCNLMPDYYEHCINNKNSIITKIYGLYRIEWESIGMALNLMVMSNICGFPKKVVSSTYDMKGSQFSRQVLKKDEYQDKKKIKRRTLKDLDFMELEKKLNIPIEIRNELY
mmetsp:Transcript_2633/g.2269  ORF Transcript_2633/g.2269 Transcript_2633/m.2269 type:complete len:168 (+) Transcript_2633:687-1190(+)